MLNVSARADDARKNTASGIKKNRCAKLQVVPLMIKASGFRFTANPTTASAIVNARFFFATLKTPVHWLNIKAVNPTGKPNQIFSAPKLTRTRIVLALAVAIFADALQLLLGFFGWTFADQIIDVAAMLLVSWLIGFHWLLLPTFVLELVPFVDELPTWTACVIAVIALRKREQKNLRSQKPKQPIEI